MNEERKQAIVRLISKIADGESDRRDLEELSQLMAGDASAQQLYLDHMTVHALLEYEFDAGAPFSERDEETTAGVAHSPDATHLENVSSGAGTSEQVHRSARREGLGDWDPRSGDSANRQLTTRDMGLAGRAKTGYQRIVRSLRTPLLTVPLLLMISFLGAGIWLKYYRLRSWSPTWLVLLNPSFENDLEPVSGTGNWMGGQVESVGTWFDITPVDGERMLRFVEPASESRNDCRVYQLVDWNGVKPHVGEEPLVKAFAHFNSLAEDLNDGGFVFGVRVYALADQPDLESGEITYQSPTLSLASSERRLLADANADTWQFLSTELKVPPETRYLLIQLSVAGDKLDNNGRFPGQLADDVGLIVLNN